MATSIESNDFRRSTLLAPMDGEDGKSKGPGIDTKVLSARSGFVQPSGNVEITRNLLTDTARPPARGLTESLAEDPPKGTGPTSPDAGGSSGGPLPVEKPDPLKPITDFMNGLKLDAGRPLGDQTGMPQGVVPRNRRLTGNELPPNALNAFVQDPTSFAASYFINTMRNFVMPGRTVPDARPGQTVNGSDNIVGFTINRVDAQNTEMTVTGRPSELARPGTPSSALAYYLPFTNGGATTIRVPRNPGPGDPQFVVTGPFTGCSFYVREDPNDPNSLLFTHDPRRGVGTTTAPRGIPDNAVGMSYEATYGREHGMPERTVPSASAFASYNRETRQWVMHVQDAVVETPPPGTRQGSSVQRSRTPGRIQGAFIPIVFGNRPPTPQPDPNLPGPSTNHNQGNGSFWAAFGAGGGTGAVIGGGAGSAVGPAGTVVGGAGGFLLGAFIAGTAWLFNWAQHENSRP